MIVQLEVHVSHRTDIKKSNRAKLTKAHVFRYPEAWAFLFKMQDDTAHHLISADPIDLYPWPDDPLRSPAGSAHK